MTAPALLFVAGTVYVGWQILRTFPLLGPFERAPRASGPLTARELAGLVGVQYEDDLVLVSPRGVELPYSPEWDLDDVLATLAEVDAL